MRTAIENAVVLTMGDDMRVLDRGYVLTDGKNIAEVGEGAFTGEADERIDARGGILLPGFVNTHCHVSMVPFRTMGDDCPDRLRRFLFPLENEAMTRELVYRGAVFGIGEMLLAGVTTFADMYYFEDEVARACVQTGMRGYLGETLISQPTCDSAQPGGGQFGAKGGRGVPAAGEEKHLWMRQNLGHRVAGAAMRRYQHPVLPRAPHSGG